MKKIMRLFPIATLLILLAGPGSTLFAQLTIAVATGNATPVAGGAAFAYTLTVANSGAGLTFVKVVDPLPPSVVFQNVAVSGAAMSCSGPPVGTNGAVICDTALFPTGSATITIVAQIAPSVASGVRTNTATVVSGTISATGSIQQNIQVDAPLSITKAGPAELQAGDTATYKITVHNGGSSTALNATIQDDLPIGTSFVSVAGTAAFFGTCDFNGGSPGSVTCASVDIPTGPSTLNISVKTAAGFSGALSNTATITTAGTGSIAVGTSTTTAQVIFSPHHHTSGQ